jgi:hypothetical protein
VHTEKLESELTSREPQLEDRDYAAERLRDMAVALPTSDSKD